jgi:hypothetical protein
MFDKQSVRVLGRVSIVMLFVGVGVGLASLLTWEWIEASVTSGSGLSTIQKRVVNGYTPLAFLIITAITAPVVAGLLGILEGLRMDSPRTTAYVALGCLVGAALLVFVAGIFIGMTGPESSGDGPVSPTNLVSLAGLSGLVSVLSGSLTALFGSR